jgi:hypothetical protein
MKSIAFALSGLLIAGVLLAPALAGATPGGLPDATIESSTPAGAQDFQDVPLSHPFYSYIHNLYVDNVISGYPCGGTNPPEPCVPPSNLPYFRPANNVTRSQNAKLEDNGRRHITGAWTGAAPYYGLFSAINSDGSAEGNAGLYGSGATGVRGESHTSGTAIGYAGYFRNYGGSSVAQYGVYATTSAGVGVYGEANLAALGTGGQFYGYTGALINGHAGSLSASGDGIDVGGGGGLSNAIYAPVPAGDTNYTLYGNAHVHGSNIAASEYEQEAVFDGATPLPLGRVVALDPANVEGGPLGVVAADADNADAAIGVVSYRLDTAKVNGEDKTYIDAGATEVHRGDRIYITFAGRVKMHLDTPAKVGTRLAVGPAGSAVVAPAGGSRATFGKVASQASADNTVDVIVSFK